MAKYLPEMPEYLGRFTFYRGILANDQGSLPNDRPDFSKYQWVMKYLVIFSHFGGAGIPANRLWRGKPKFGGARPPRASLDTPPCPAFCR